MKTPGSTPNKARRPDLERGDDGDRARARELEAAEAAELEREARRRRAKPATK